VSNINKISFHPHTYLCICLHSLDIEGCCFILLFSSSIYLYLSLFRSLAHEEESLFTGAREWGNYIHKFISRVHRSECLIWTNYPSSFAVARSLSEFNGFCKIQTFFSNSTKPLRHFIILLLDRVSTPGKHTHTHTRNRVGTKYVNSW
jgi:hypothetical protein